MKLYQILFLFFTTLFCKSLSSKNSNYDVCSEKLKCGNLDDEVGYPFYYGSIRPDYCGYPGFKLNCSQDIAQITINQTNFYVSQINSEKYSVSVYREDKWRSFCPDSLGNTAMDYSKFNFTSSDQNISFFYDCGESNDLSSLLLQTSCNLGKYGSNSGYYLTQAMLDQYKYLDLSKICDASLFIPILKSNAQGLDRDPNLGKLQDAFMNGFELGLMAENDVCSRCDDSGGECGYNWASNKFVCHCDDSDYDDHCKDDSSEQGTGTNIAKPWFLQFPCPDESYLSF